MDIRRIPASGKDNDPFTRLGLILALMAFLSAGALDLIDHFQGERSYLFGLREPAAEKFPVPLEKALFEALSEAGLSQDNFSSSSSADETINITLNAGTQELAKTKASLEKSLPGKNIQIEKRTKPEAGPPGEESWILSRGKGEKIKIDFKAREEAVPKPPVIIAEKPVVKSEPSPAKRRRPQVALIVDDMGESLESLEVIMNLHFPVTIAVLPGSQHSQETIFAARQKDIEILLHLPLESINNHGSHQGLDGFITTSMSNEEIVQKFRDDLSLVPYAAGVNNHMGSRFTADERLMKVLLSAVKDAGLFFVDSRTSSDSVAFTEARKMGVQTAERDVFLDADEDRSLIRSRLVELLRTAQKRGSAVGICHPFPETLEVLQSGADLLEKYGLQAVPVSRLVH